MDMRRRNRLAPAVDRAWSIPEATARPRSAEAAALTGEVHAR
jgi:hypothetical protein